MKKNDKSVILEYAITFIEGRSPLKKLCLGFAFSR